jgi:periplasmic protein CpxP/Spy
MDRDRRGSSEGKNEMQNKLITLALTTFLGLGTVGAAVAAPQDQQAPAPPQAEHHRPADPNRQVKMLTKKLNLTADQQNQLLPILTDRQQQVAGILADNSLSPKDRHAKMRAVREDSDAKIRALLTDSQKQTYDQMLQQQRERMQQRREQKQSGL